MDKSTYGIYKMLTNMKRRNYSMSQIERSIAKAWITVPILSIYNALIWVLIECGCDKYAIMSAIHQFEKENGFDDYGCIENIESRPLVRL